MLDLDGHTLTLAPAVGSAGTVSSGIRVLAKSELEIKDGKIVCSKDAADNIKVGIANYGTLKLKSVELVAGPVTVYSINNRGELTLSGSTKIVDGTNDNFQFAITNDPYEYVYSNTDAVVKCDSADVTVGSMQVERYERNTTNKGGVVLNISAGTFGKIVEDGKNAIDVDYNVTGGTIRVGTAKDLAAAVNVAGSKGAVTIKLTDDVTQSFDLGNESGSAPKNVVLDLNGHTLTLAPAVGSTGTVSSGIRVLANSSLVIKNGKVVCSDDASDNIKVGIANYSELTLKDVELVAGPVTIYSINNRGELTLTGDTTIANGKGDKFQFAITNDPYEYVYSDTDAVLNCKDGDVTVGDVQVERYERNTTNKGGIVLNITAGKFGKLVDDGKTAVDAEYNITGGTYANDVDKFAADGYESVDNGDGTYGIAFVKLEQKPLEFDLGSYISVLYGEDMRFTLGVTGGSGSGKLSFEVVKGDSVEIVDTYDHGVSIRTLKYGESVIRVTKAGNDTYLPATAEITVYVNLDSRYITFAEDNVTVPYGTLTYTNPATLSRGDGEIVYSIKQGSDIASIDKKTGELTFKDGGVGKVVVRAYEAGNDCYLSADKTYTLTVKALETPKDPYELSGKKGENGWYRSDVVLTAKEGYTLSTSDSLTGNDWSESLTITKEGKTTQKIYLKNADGHITAAIEAEIKIDKTAPSGLSIGYANQKWKLGSLLGGNKAVDVTFNVTEEGSGIAKLEYSKDGEKYETVTAKDGKYTVSVDPQYRGQISFKVTDKAGWETQLDSDGKTLVVDSIAPNVELKVVGEYGRDDDGSLISEADEIKVIYTIEEANADLMKEDSTININGVFVPIEWVEQDGKYVVTLTFTEENTYDVKVTFTDRSNEVFDPFVLKIDRTPAKITVKSTETPANTIDGIDYFSLEKGEKVQVQMLVNEWGFKTSRASAQVEYKNANGQSRPWNGSTNNWNKTNTQGTQTLDFENEGTYTVTATYKEGNWMNPTVYTETYTFVIDNSSPQNLNVDYQDLKDSGVVERLKKMFGFSDKTVNVTISAKDALSGIHYLEYSVNGEDYIEVSSDDLKNGAYTFRIDAEYRDTIKFNAYDKASNSASKNEQMTLVIDTTDPELTVGYEGAYTASSDEADKLNTNDEAFRLIFTASDDNFDIRKNDPKIQIRKVGEKTWKDHKNVTLSADGAEVTVELPEDGLYEVKYLFEDWLRTTEKVMTVNVDRTGATINAVFAKEDGNENHVRYYASEQQVKVEITDANFDASKVDLNVTLNGVEQADYADRAVNAANWTAKGNTYTLTLNFDQEGTYTLTVKADDALGNAEQTAVNEKFVIDLSDPADLKIDYADLTFVEVIGGWFGFTTEDVTVTLSAEDPISDLNLVEISLNGRDFVEVKPDANGKYTHTIPAEYRDCVTMRVTDKAGRVSTYRDSRAVVVDTIAPNIFDTYPVSFRDFGGVYYSNAVEFPVELLIEDANYDLRAQNAVVTVNGAEQELTWTEGTSLNGEPNGTATVLLSGEGVNELYASFDDRLNPAEWNQTVVLDRTAPVMDVTFSGELQNVHNNKFFFNTNQTVTISIAEINFLAEEVVLKVTKDGKEMTPVIASDWNANNELALSFVEDGIYTLEVSYTDLAGNPGVKKDSTETTYKVQFVVDTKAPTVDSITYDQEVVKQILEAVSLGFFKAPLNVTVAASDETAGVNTIHYTYIGTQGINDATEISVEDYQQVNEKGEITFQIDSGFYGEVTAWAVDYSNLESDHVNVAKDTDGKEFQMIVVDSGAPEREVAIYPADGILNILDGKTMENLEAFAEGDDVVLYFDKAAEVVVTVTEDNFDASNYTVAITKDGQPYEHKIEWATDGNVHACLLNLAEEGDYLVNVTGTDNSGNKMEDYASQRIVVDQTAPVIDVAYKLNEDQERGKAEEAVTIEPNNEEPWNTQYYFDRPMTATITIEERNFRASDVKILVTASDVEGNVVLALNDDGVVEAYYEQGKTQNADREKDASKWSAFQGNWRRADGKYVIDLVFNADANYTFAVEYADLAGNASAYEQRTFCVDNFDPVIIVEGITDAEYKYYSDDETALKATIKIQDQNLDAENIVYTITATDSTGAVVADFVDPELTKAANWTYENGFWTAEVSFEAEANYVFTLSYTDRSGRVGEVNGKDGENEYRSEFTVDFQAPTDLAITYQDTEKVFDEDGTTTLYFDKDTQVTLSARDLTAGMMKFVLTVTPDGHETACSYELPTEAVEIPYNAKVEDINELLKNGITADSITYENGLMTVVLNVPAEFRGSFSFDAVDMAELTANMDDEYVVVTDSKAPERVVELEPTQIVDRATMKNFEGELKEDSNVVLYFNGEAKIDFTLTEANFYEDEPVFTVNGQIVTLIWTEDAEKPGTYHASHTMYDDGDYVVELTYTDRSGNEMIAYTSQRIVIDTIAPQVTVSYDNNNVKNTIGGREYYDNNRVATITIREENFRADDVKVMVTSTDVTGSNVANSYAEQAATRNKWSAYNGDVEWRRVDDTYVLTLTYSADANYTFDIEYKDMATNAATYRGQTDYIADVFTVDHNAPEKLNISYSKEVLETILQGVSFGFYDAKMTVTMRADDVTAGVHRFVYSYVTSDGVSKVNSSKTEQVINESAIKYSNNGRTATATFTIPQSALNDKNQFNGTVNFTVYDRSMNSAKLSDKERIVVDNISPVATVTYNKPVQTVDGVAYYSGKIEATITINEANFYRDDVTVSVTRDGANYSVKPTWTDSSADIHVGKFVLDKEGDYIVTIRHTDKSGNSMKQYVSGKMIIDLEAPTIQVSNVVPNSANKDDVYSFTITVNDADGNMKPGDIAPSLSYVVRDENGNHTTEYFDLGAATVVASGKTYTYTVEDLPEDAIYMLECSAKDLAGNTVNVMNLDNGSAESSVRFSINRHGSTFEYGNDSTRDLAAQYYVQNVTNDIVIREINVDPVEQFTVTVNGKNLVNGVDYKTSVSGGGSTWSVRTYTISKSLFAEEGEYNVIVSSVDATNTTVFSDMKNLSMAFVVDRTPPTLVLGGLEEGGRYQDEKQIVTLIPSDEGGQLANVRVELFADGADPATAECIAVLFEKSGDELLEYLRENDGIITFEVPEGYQHLIRIICSDYAQGDAKTTNEYIVTYSDVTVSPDALVIFFANKPAFYGTVFGVLALLMFIFFLIFKRKKREDEEEAA